MRFFTTYNDLLNDNKIYYNYKISENNFKTIKMVK